MKLAEFKAWFEGFTESLDGTPSAKQWRRIKEQVGAIDGVAITERVYIDRYWPRYQAIGIGYPYWSSAQASGAISAVSMAGQNAVQNGAFDSHSAMYAAGKAESLAS